MAVNEFLKFDESDTNIVSYATYLASAIRTDGFPFGSKPPSNITNRFYRDTAAFVYAFGEFMKAQGYDASPDDIPALIANILPAIEAGIGAPAGDIVGTTDTQTLSNKTLTAPKLASGGYIADANGNELLKAITIIASAINEWTIANASIGNKPVLQLSGDDTNISGEIKGKGTGKIFIDGIAFRINSGIFEYSLDGGSWSPVGTPLVKASNNVKHAWVTTRASTPAITEATIVAQLIPAFTGTIRVSFTGYAASSSARLLAFQPSAIADNKNSGISGGGGGALPAPISAPLGTVIALDYGMGYATLVNQSGTAPFTVKVDMSVIAGIPVIFAISNGGSAVTTLTSLTIGYDTITGTTTL